MGAGHGSYDTTRALSPHACAILEANDGKLDSIVLAVALIQYPIYGMLIGAAGRLFQTPTDRIRGIFFAFLILLFHSCVVAYYRNMAS